MGITTFTQDDSSPRILATITELVDPMPDVAVESYAGVANPFSLRRLVPGERVVDVGSGAASTASSRLPTWVNREP